MIKRIIAIAAAVLMLIGSTQIPQASNGELVRQEEQHDRTASVSSENSSGNSGPEEAPESADESARRTTDTDRLPDRRVAAVTETSKGAEVDGGEIFRVVTEISEGEDSGSHEEDGTGTDSAPADGAEPDPEGYSEDAPADSWEAEVVPEEPAPDTAVDSDAIEEVEDPVPQMEYLGDWTISFYCSCSQCCGQWAGGATASGAMPTPWYTVATGDLPFGTILYIDGLGEFEVQDRGTEYGWLDVFVSDHGEALANGLQTRAVYIVR